MSDAVQTPPEMPVPVPTHSRKADVQDVLSSMRFAISLLTIICIASVIGTVLKQGESLVNYVDAFGPFWAEFFGALGLFRVYGSPWFLAILAFLVVSTSLCLARNVPKIIVDLRTYKEHIREQSLGAFHHKATGRLSMPLTSSRDDVVRVLGVLGWNIKTQERVGDADTSPGVMIAARRGAINRLGYISAHSAIVLVCVGGLFDGDLITKTQAWARDLQPFRGGTPTDRNRMSVDNPAYRAQLFVPEGQRSASAVLNLDQGMLLQPLPFEVELKKFIVDYYDTGMPKRFASEIVVRDPRDGSSHAATVEVNKPFVYDGVTIFQSSFEDGGSQVQLRPVPMAGPAGSALEGAVLSGVVGEAGQAVPASLTPQGPLTLEITALRPINVEDLSSANRRGGDGDGPTGNGNGDTEAAAASSDVRGVNLKELSKHLGSGVRGEGGKQLVNVGPSVTYKLRDQAGQAREYQNYMMPITLGGSPVFLLGVRNTPAESFRFLRVPADERSRIDGWWRLRQALLDPAARALAASRFAARGASLDQPELGQQLLVSSQNVLDLFAGAKVLQPKSGAAPVTGPRGGLVALSEFIDDVVPEPDRERMSATLIGILHTSLFDLFNLSRTQAGLPEASPDDPVVQAFMTQSVLALSDATAYPAPAIFMLDNFEQRQASVFQVTRTPGRNVVYLGCVLLIVGVFSMLYVRERRVWVWLQTDPQLPGETTVKLAMSCTRQTLDLDAEFDRLRAALLPASAFASESVSASALVVADAPDEKGL